MCFIPSLCVSSVKHQSLHLKLSIRLIFKLFPLVNYVIYFYTKQLLTLGGIYLIFSLSISFVIFILVMLITL
jgi:hypothetical protein